MSKRGSRNGCDILKCLPTLAGLRRHSDSTQRAFKKIRHTVEICV
jgi:hypothetical protein